MAGLAPLAVALEEKKTSALRKAHLIFMARSWGYKCDLWTPKHDRAADRALEQLQRRAAADAEAKHAPALPLPRFGATAVAAWNGVWDESLLVPDAVWLFAQKALRPLSLRVAAGFAGDDARAAALTHGDAHVTLTLATEVSRVAAMMPFSACGFGLARFGFIHRATLTRAPARAPVAQNLGGVHSTIISGARSLSAEMASQPAWRCLASPPFNVTDSLLRGVMDSANGLISAVARASSLRIRKGGLNPAERVWLQEMARTSQGFCFCSRTQQSLTPHRRAVHVAELHAGAAGAGVARAHRLPRSLPRVLPHGASIHQHQVARSIVLTMYSGRRHHAGAHDCAGHLAGQRVHAARALECVARYIRPSHDARG